MKIPFLNRYLVVLLLVLCGAMSLQAEDGDGGNIGATRVYCYVTQSWWTSEGATVGLYAYADGDVINAAWPGVRMTQEETPGLWSANIDPNTYSHIIFTRMAPATGGENQDWGAQTANLSVPTSATPVFVITSSTAVWSPETVTGYWTAYDADGNYNTNPNAGGDAASYFLTGSFNTWSLGDALPMDGDSAQLTLPAGTYSFKVLVSNVTWDGAMGYNSYNPSCSIEGVTTDEDGNIVVTLTDTGVLTFRVEQSAVCVRLSQAASQGDEYVYSLLGTSALFGTDWDYSDTRTELTLQGENMYTYVIDSVALQTGVDYEYKVVTNHMVNVREWPSIEGGDNYHLSVEESGMYQVLFSFDPSTGCNATTMYLHGEINYGNSVARIGDVGFASLEEAFADAEDGEIITMLADATTGATIWIGTVNVDDPSRSLTLDLNGHNISSGTTVEKTIILSHGALNITGQGRIMNTSSSSGATVIEMYGTYEKNSNPRTAEPNDLFTYLNVSENVTIAASGVSNTSASAITVMQLQSGSIDGVAYRTTMDGSTLAASYGVANGVRVDIHGYVNGYKYGIKVNGTLTCEVKEDNSINGVPVAEGDTMYCPFVHIYPTASVTSLSMQAKSIAVYASGYARWLIEGDCSAATGIYVKSGDVAINDAYITSNYEGEAVLATSGHSGITSCGSAIEVEAVIGYLGGQLLSVSGETTLLSTASGGAALAEIITNAASTEENVITLNSGTYKAENVFVISNITSTDTTVTVYGSNTYPGALVAGGAFSQAALNAILADDVHATQISTADGITVTISEGAHHGDCTPQAGTCGADGDNLTWTISCDSVLTINGSGAMANYNGSSQLPWHDYLTHIRTAIISEGVTSLSSSSTFEGCTNLVSVIIPEGIISLGDYTFSDCSSLRTVNLPSTMTSLGSYCFSNCAYIDSIICRADTPPTANGSTFAGVNYMIPIYVPTNTSDLYRAANGWDGFTDYREMGGDDTGAYTVELNHKWTFVMIPSTFGMNPEDIVTEGDVQWATYNGSVRAMGSSGWENYDAASAHMCSQALIVRATGDTATLTITVPEQAKNMSETTITLIDHPSVHQENANWNFIGNPYPYNYDIMSALDDAGFESPITVWNGVGYMTYTPGLDSYTLQPFETFFIQIPDGGQQIITFKPMYIEGGIDSGANGVVDAYGALPGRFSVSDSKQIQFSRGNLQYRASSQSWRFADNQYDVIGEANANISETYNGWIDLFGWGTGGNPTLVSTTNSDYSTFVDWGTNTIKNGGKEANMWYTLTKNEWVYLFNTRANATTLWGLGTVNGMNGAIVLPDDWSGADNIVFQPGKSEFSKVNVYDLSEWAIMERAGAVFLPIAGYRNGEKVIKDLGTHGYYWSATRADSSYGYNLWFYSNFFSPNQSNSRFIYGNSVRLVK